MSQLHSTVTSRISVEMHREVTRLAKASQRTISDVVEAAIRYYLADQRRARIVELREELARLEAMGEEKQ